MNQSNPPPRNMGIHPLLPQAVSLHQAGRLGDAATLYEKILSEMPGQFDAAHLLGVIALQTGNLKDAQRRIVAALQLKPDDAPAHSNLSAAYLRDNQLDAALKHAQIASALYPDSVDSLINLGTILRQMNRFRDAIDPLKSAHAITPKSPLVCNLLGVCLLNSGDARGAVQMFESVVGVVPGDSEGWLNLSNGLKVLGQLQRAMECFARSAALRGDSTAALSVQAASQFELGKIDEAIATYRKIVNATTSVQTLCSFAIALIASGLNDEAIGVAQQAIQKDAANPIPRWIKTFAHIKPICERAADVELSRNSYAKSLNDLKFWLDKNSSPETYRAVGTSQPFYLAYQPFDNKELMIEYGQLCTRAMQTAPGARDCKPPIPGARSAMRIGIASAQIREHSVWNAITKGWVEQLDKSRFELHLFQLSPIHDAETLVAKQHAHHFHDKPKDISGWIRAILDADLDFLIYPEIGMDPLTAQLAALRLAPLQAVTWGNPLTTGLSTIDIYLSAETMEPVDAQSHYSEKLICLPNLSVYVNPLSPKQTDPDLLGLGIPTDEPLLLCPGTPFKYSPIYDSVIVSIAKGLAKAGHGRMLFFSSSSGSMHLQLINRLRRVFSESEIDFDDQVCVVPVLERARFYGLMGRATLMLDTLGFSGFNTALQGIECGLPVLAYDGEFMRGRLASCIMRRLNLPELIADSPEDFVARALELIADSEQISRLRALIAGRRHKLFHDLEAVRGLEGALAKEIMLNRQRTSP